MNSVGSSRGIECLVGKARLLIPAEFVAGVLELEVAPPPPLSRKWVGGLGFHENRAMVCVSLIGPGLQGAPRRVKGLHLGVEDSDTGWLLEVNSVGTFVEVQRLERKAVPGSGLPAWVGAAADIRGQSYGWVDVRAMIKELVGSA
jgi:hypothetical protein